MQPSSKRTDKRLPNDPDENAIAILTAAIRSAWTKREERRRLRVDHQTTRIRVQTVSTRDLGLTVPFRD
jgi:hypothetical protein